MGICQQHSKAGRAGLAGSGGGGCSFHGSEQLSSWPFGLFYSSVRLSKTYFNKGCPCITFCQKLSDPVSYGYFPLVLNYLFT